MTTVPNARISYAASACQLSYSLQSVPSVLQTSVAGAESSVADITLTIFNNTEAPVTIDSIVVTLPVGDDASSLVVDVSSITPSAAPSSLWTVNSPSLASADTTAAYTLLPLSGTSAPLAAGAAIVVTLAGVQINHFTGTASIAVDETTSAGAGSTAIGVTKYPPGFFFDSLLVNVANGSVLQPMAQVARTTEVTLSWNVSALDPSAIAIFYSSNQGQQGPFHPPQVNQSSPIAIFSDTVFTVIVTTTAASGEPVVSALSTSVSVQQPDLIAQSLTAAGQAKAGSINCTGTATISGALSVTGATTLAAASVSGCLDVSGPATPDKYTLEVHGPANIHGTAMMRIAGTGFLQISGNPANSPGLMVYTPLGVTQPAATISNYNTSPGNPSVRGLSIMIKSPSDTALWANGQIVGTSGVGQITPIATARGDAVYTTPLCPEIELHLSGTARLLDGGAHVVFDPNIADAIAPSGGLRVQVTPAGLCNGLAVVERDHSGFSVRECLDGASDVAFDWFVVARKRASFDNHAPHELPESFPVPPEWQEPPLLTGSAESPAK